MRGNRLKKKSLRLSSSRDRWPDSFGRSVEGYNEIPPHDQASRLVIGVLRGRLAKHRGIAIRPFSAAGLGTSVRIEWNSAKDAASGDIVRDQVSERVSWRDQSAARRAACWCSISAGQTAQLIARRIRDANVFCQLVRHDLSAPRIRELAPRGLILSGGPASIYESRAPEPDPEIFELGIPVLGICYGMHAACRAQGSRVTAGYRARVRPDDVPRAGGRRPFRRTAGQNGRLDESWRPGRRLERDVSNRWRRPTRAPLRPCGTARSRFTACNFIPK